MLMICILLETNTALFIVCHLTDIGRRGGLMVSVQDSGSNDPGLSPGQGHGVVFFIIVLHPTQVYKTGTRKIMLGGNPAMD